MCGGSLWFKRHFLFNELFGKVRFKNLENFNTIVASARVLSDVFSERGNAAEEKLNI